MAPANDDTTAALRALVDEYRSRCLWFLRPGYYPDSAGEAMRVLDAIQRHGDLDAFRRAGEIRQWLSTSISAPSANS